MKYFKLLALSAAMILLSSCGATKRLTYIQDMEPGIDYPVANHPLVTVMKGDKLGIMVTCSNPALAAPFNMVSGVSSVNGSSGDMSYEASSEAKKGYLVDDEGEIDFPILGKIQVGDMTLDEVKETIEEAIREKSYIKDPVVEVEYLNFEIVILGETGASVMAVPDGNINIFQAIAKSGDLSMTALRNDVRVVRLEDGVRRMYSLDLTNTSCFSSPAYYLKQNDMVYVKPNKRVRDNYAEGSEKRATLFMTLVSTLSTVSYWFSIILSR